MEKRINSFSAKGVQSGVQRGARKKFARFALAPTFSAHVLHLSDKTRAVSSGLVNLYFLSAAGKLLSAPVKVRNKRGPKKLFLGAKKNFASFARKSFRLKTLHAVDSRVFGFPRTLHAYCSPTCYNSSYSWSGQIYFHQFINHIHNHNVFIFLHLSIQLFI